MTSTVRPQPDATAEKRDASPAATAVGTFQPGGWWARRKALIGDEPRVAALLAAVAAVQALGGAGLWLVVLSSFDTIDIGWVGSLIASVQLAGLLGGAGLPIVVARHRDHTSSRLILAGAVLVTLAGSATALVALALAGSPALSLRGGALVALVGSAAATAVVTDAALSSQRQWRRLLARVAAAAILRIALVAAVAATTGSRTALILALLGPDALTSFLALPLPRRWPFADGLLGLDRDIVLYTGTQYASTLLLLGPMLALPVLAGRFLASAERAVFYPAWSLVAVVSTVAASAAAAPLIACSSPVSRRHDRFVPSVISIGAAGGALLAATLPVAGRLGDVADAAAMLLVANLGWPWLTRRLAVLRAADDNRATLTAAAVWAVGALGAVTVLRDALDVATIGLIWASSSIAAAVSSHLAARQP